MAGPVCEKISTQKYLFSIYIGILEFFVFVRSVSCSLLYITPSRICRGKYTNFDRGGSICLWLPESSIEQKREEKTRLFAARS